MALLILPVPAWRVGAPVPLRLATLAALLVTALSLSATGSAAQVLLTQEEALELAFPDARVERETAYLTDAQLREVRRLAGGDVPIESSVVTRYRATLDGQLRGVAYFDAHRVRTLPEVLMVVVGPDGRVRRLEVLRFSEPREYMAPEGWMRQFEDRELGPEVSLKGEIVNITGATLTSRAVTRAVRRTLALHRVLEDGSGRETLGTPGGTPGDRNHASGASS